MMDEDELSDDWGIALDAEHDYHMEVAQSSCSLPPDDYQPQPPAGSGGMDEGAEHDSRMDVATAAEEHHRQEELLEAASQPLAGVAAASPVPMELAPPAGAKTKRRTRRPCASAPPAKRPKPKAEAAAIAYEAAAAQFEIDTTLAEGAAVGTCGVGVSVRTPGLANRIGLRHKLAEHRGALWCWHCGGWSKSARGGVVRAVLLINDCGKPTSKGLAVLSRLRRGLPPDSKAAKWPSDGG
jgi:hypothetical protein